MKENEIQLFDSLTNVDNELYELNALLSVLHTACDGKDELQPEEVQAYTDVMIRQLTLISEHFQNVMHSAQDLIDQDQEEELIGVPLLYTDPETGEQRIFQDPEI